MNFEDIVDAMNELREDNYEPETLIINNDQRHDLLSDANMATASSPPSQSQGNHIGTVAGADVEVDDNKSTALLKSKYEHKAVPVIDATGFVHENVNGHHLVETHEAVSCIECDEELTGLDSPEKKRWAHGHFLSHNCPE